MPRTKVARHMNKRARDNASEIDDILRDYDIEVENSLQKIRTLQQQNLDDAETTLENFKKQLGVRLLKLTMSELRKMETYDDVETAVQQTMNDFNMTVKETVQKADEGYVTGELSNKSQLSSDSDALSVQRSKVSTLSALKPFKSRRRSQSTSNLPAHTTPGPRAMMKLKTPNVKSVFHDVPASSHMSRSKFRTPLATQNPPQRQRAASVDRITTITPKVNPSAPVALLRHAKPGEVAFSITGSPIVTSIGTGASVNMNIPYANGILHIRPEQLDSNQLDSTLIHNAVGSSIDEMRMLKNALDQLVSSFEKRLHH